jgi:hypothetical protein
MSLDLNKLKNKLDKALNNETSESLNEWLGNKRMSNTIGVTWDEYGNPIPITNDEQYIIDYNVMEEEWEMDNYNEMNNE